MIEFNTEIKNYVKAIVGDIRVDVDITFYPSRPTSDFQESMTVDQINARLAALAGEIRYDIQKIIKEKLKDREEVTTT